MMGGEQEQKAWDTFASEIKKRREQRKWTQKQLADRAGVSQDSVSKAEQGTTRLGFRHLVKLCATLGTSPDAMMGWEKNVRLENSDELVIRFRDAAATLPASSVVAILDLMEKLAKHEKPR